MTIVEHLRREAKIANIVKWAGVGLTVALVMTHSGDSGFVWGLAGGAITVVAMSVAMRRLRCPRCRARMPLEGKWASALVADFCPKCGVDLKEPYESPANAQTVRPRGDIAAIPGRGGMRDSIRQHFKRKLWWVFPLSMVSLALLLATQFIHVGLPSVIQAFGRPAAMIGMFVMLAALTRTKCPACSKAFGMTTTMQIVHPFSRGHVEFCPNCRIPLDGRMPARPIG